MARKRRDWRQLRIAFVIEWSSLEESLALTHRLHPRRFTLITAPREKSFARR
jgi:hypothetical protein